MNKKKKIVLAISIIYLVSVLIINNVWGYIITILFVLFLLINLLAYRKFSFIATHLFTTIGRNYERLIIADNCDLSSLTKDFYYLSFISYESRSIQAVNLLVKRLYSLLDEKKGELIIVMRKPKKTKGIAVADIPYFHENTLADLDKQYMKYFCRLPLLFNPLATIKLFINVSKRKPVESILYDNELKHFLDSRNIKYKFYIIK
ncbi:hypothetical protein [Phocaeicola coprocola]|jgi:hypothetical protein|uniref:hypothetical protein n=1 Tax=Phocaeicola coprocola TaxID=310298 RepID=UPI003F7DA7F4